MQREKEWQRTTEYSRTTKAVIYDKGDTRKKIEKRAEEINEAMMIQNFLKLMIDIKQKFRKLREPQAG